jgi:hypothetical protein
MKHYAFIDYATQLYLALVAVIILVLHGNAVPGWPWLVAAHAVTIVGIHGLILITAARPRNRALDFFRHFYPVLLYAGLYRETAALNQMVHRGYLDAFFYRLDEQIFGGAPWGEPGSLARSRRVSFFWLLNSIRPISPDRCCTQMAGVRC